MSYVDNAEKRRDPDLVHSEAALRRAAERARERARRASGYVVVFRNGEIVKEKPGNRDS